MRLHPVAASAATISAATSGSHRALEEIFGLYQPALLRYLRTRAPDLADDVAAQTWVSVIESISRFHGDGAALRGWILTIGHRRLVDEFRRRGRRLDEPIEVPDVVDDVTPEHIVTSRVGLARRLLSRLPPRQADVVLLRVIGGLSVSEVVEATGLSESNVRVLAHRGLGRLRELLGGDAAAVGSTARGRAV
ncbi:MAG: RNA polymerase sigma factor [Acidimicrobiales bacterium]